MITIFISLILASWASTPIRLVILLILFSIICRLAIIMLNNREFFPIAIVLSFSRGIIIIFFYCRIFSSHEIENKINKIVYTTIIVVSLIIISEEKISNNRTTRGIAYLEKRIFLLIAIITVILAIVCINERMINPNKSLLRGF